MAAAALAAFFVVACTEGTTTPKAAITPRSGLTVSQSLASVAAAQTGTPTDQHVFMMNGNSIPDSFAADVAAAGGTVLRVHPEIGVAVARGLTDAAAQAIARGQARVERDVLVQWVPTLEDVQGTVLDAEAPDVGITAGSPLTAAFLPFQWNMRQIHALEAWVDHTGTRNVRVAILDTGLDPDHIDQSGTIDAASSVAFTPSLNGPPEWADDQFHGTHVGGIVTTNNIGTAGVAPNVTLIAIKVLNASGSGSFADVIAGLLWAAQVHADVANMSLGAFFPKTGATATLVAALNKAVNYANAHDVLVVSAAGNAGVDLQHDENFVEEPCEAGTGICIDATGPTDTKASYSNYGVPAIDVAAPGGDFGPPPTSFVLSPCSSRSVIPALATCRSRVRYLFVIGTSQATPHVSGLAALFDSQFGGTLDPAQLETNIQQCSDDLGKPGVDPFYGQGRINVFKTVNQVGCNNGTP
jgi:subtilisin family serine protease